jgi:hypothetical protein
MATPINPSFCLARDSSDCQAVVTVPQGIDTFRVSVALSGLCIAAESVNLGVYKLGECGCKPLVVYAADGIDDEGRITFLLDSSFLNLPNVRYAGLVYQNGSCSGESCASIELDKEIICAVTSVTGQGGVDNRSAGCL